MAPTWYFCSLPTYIHSFCNDPFNKNYSRFTYLPQAFRMGPRLSQHEMTTCTKCIDYVNALRLSESEGRFMAVERYVMTKCTSTPDMFQSFYDDNFEKIPRTNSAIRHLLLSSCTFKCLTLFPIQSSITHV